MVDSRRKARLRVLERRLGLVALNYTRDTRPARAEAPLPLSNISLRRYCIESGSLPAENDFGSPCDQDGEPTSMLVFLPKMDSDSGQRDISVFMRSIRSFICTPKTLLHIQPATRVDQKGQLGHGCQSARWLTREGSDTNRGQLQLRFNRGLPGPGGGVCLALDTRSSGEDDVRCLALDKPF